MVRDKFRISVRFMAKVRRDSVASMIKETAHTHTHTHTHTYIYIYIIQPTVRMIYSQKNLIIYLTR